jgi:hypothetical protein
MDVVIREAPDSAPTSASGFECETGPKTESGVSLAEAVMDAVLYAEIFDYPLTRDEVCLFVSTPNPTREDVSVAVDQLLGLERGLETDGDFVFRKGERRIVATRLGRRKHAEYLWRRALVYGWIISALPYVRMVAVTGALSMDNVDAGGDIDYLVVTEPKRLWTTRAMIILVGKFAQRLGDTVCPNYIVSMNALEFREENLYTAHELAQMVTLHGPEIAERIYRKNAWFRRFLPNARQRMVRGCDRPLPLAARSLKSVGESLLGTAPGAALERWERQRKIRKLTKDLDLGADEMRFSEDVCKGHQHAHRLRVMSAWHRSKYSGTGTLIPDSGHTDVSQWGS